MGARPTAVLVAVATFASLALAPASAQAARPSLRGEWEVHIRQVSCHLFPNCDEGLSYTRAWSFERRCRGGRCRLMFVRGYAGGFDVVPLRRDGSVYRATVRTRFPCRNAPGHNVEVERFSFRVTRSVRRASRRLATRIAGGIESESSGDCDSRTATATESFTGERQDQAPARIARL